MDTLHPQVETVEIGRLFCSPPNLRLNDPAVPHVASSLRRCGWQQPIVAKRSGEVIAGNTQLKAAKELGMNEVPVWWYEGNDPHINDDRLRIAAHEAGHLVAAIALGCGSAHATMDPPITIFDNNNADNADNAAVVAAGGVAGLTVAGLPCPEDGQELDVGDAETALNRRITFDEWEAIVARAVTLLSNEPHRSMHESAIRMLVEHGEVSAADCLNAASRVGNEKEVTHGT